MCMPRERPAVVVTVRIHHVFSVLRTRVCRNEPCCICGAYRFFYSRAHHNTHTSPDLIWPRTQLGTHVTITYVCIRMCTRKRGRETATGGRDSGLCRHTHATVRDGTRIPQRSDQFQTRVRARVCVCVCVDGWMGMCGVGMHYVFVSLTDSTRTRARAFQVHRR